MLLVKNTTESSSEKIITSGDIFNLSPQNAKKSWLKRENLMTRTCKLKNVEQKIEFLPKSVAFL